MNFSLYSSSSSPHTFKNRFPIESKGGHKRKPKNIVLCFDGTNENFGPQPSTNVLKIFKLLEKSDNQVCYYQPGIGTGSSFDSVSGIRRYFTYVYLKNLVDAMFATNVQRNIKKAYLFLMRNYQEGDNIYMFGFSRGAFFARVLTGMIERVGLLYNGMEDMIDMAWGIYRSWEYAEQPTQHNITTTLVEEFRKCFSRQERITVYFQGLFDSVNSVGILRDKLFPCTQRSCIVDHVRHAVSIDERRGKFKQQSFTPNPYIPTMFSLKYKSFLMEYKNSNSETQLIKKSCNKPMTNSLIDYTIYGRNQKEVRNKLGKRHISMDNSSDEINKNSKPSYLKSPKTVEPSNHGVHGNFFHTNSSYDTEANSFLTSDLIEKWFAGDHSDIGGSWPLDCKTNQSLSNISLRWILAEAVKHGVKFKKHSLTEFDQSHHSQSSFKSQRHDVLSFYGPKTQFDADFDKRLEPLDKIIGIFRRISSDFEYFGKNKVKVNKPIRHKGVCKSTAQPLSKFQVLLWWILEWFPIGLRLENIQGKWRNTYIPNLGRQRYIPIYADIHWSVFWRIKFDANYKPQNIPAYARDLIEEFTNKRFDNLSLNAETPRVSEYQTFPKPGLLLTDSDKSLDTIKSEPGSAYSYLLSRMMYEGMVDILYLENRRQFKSWDSKNWRNIPDDLQEILQNNPDL